MNSTDKEYLVQKIRTQYTKKEATQLDKLKELDARVKRPANIFAYVFGTVGALVLGSGMSLAMGVIESIGTLMLPGIIIGCVGIAIVGLNYTIYNKLLGARRKKYADEVIRISNEIMQA